MFYQRDPMEMLCFRMLVVSCVRKCLGWGARRRFVVNNVTEWHVAMRSRILHMSLLFDKSKIASGSHLASPAYFHRGMNCKRTKSVLLRVLL